MKRLDDNNRTEKYWTATVLAALISDNYFEGMKALLTLLEKGSNTVEFEDHTTLKRVKVPNLNAYKWNYGNIQISSELWSGRDILGSTEYAVPDIVILLDNKYLIVCEAKFFQRVKSEAIENQIFLQKKAISGILSSNNIKYIHHCFIYGGSEQFATLKGIDSIITWSDIHDAFLRIKGNDFYFLKVLENGIKNYQSEFPQKTTQSLYYMDTFDIVDLIGICREKGNEVFIGLGTGGSADKTLNSLIQAAKEEFSVLRMEHDRNPARFTKRPEFLKDKKYKNQSALEYLLIHSNQPYRVDYVPGSGDNKMTNKKWIDGYSFIQILKMLIRP